MWRFSQAHKTTIYTTSVCTGGILMGAAGLLEGIDATTHWASLSMLSSYGAIPVSIRVVKRVCYQTLDSLHSQFYVDEYDLMRFEKMISWQGKIITSAGVSSGIDMAITLAALISDNFTAQVSQLYNEYDPQPPFNTGTKSKASPELIAKALEWTAAKEAKMMGTS